MTDNKDKKMIQEISIKKNGVLAETVYNKDDCSTSFIIKDELEKIKQQKLLKINEIDYQPFSADNSLIKKNIVKLPSKVEDYKNITELVTEIKDFIHDYVDISESFEIVSAYYVLMSWVYDKFDNVPYLRVRGNPGKGKSRFLNVMSVLTYKSIFFKGGSTDAILFRVLDKIQGTLVLDEADYKHSGKTAVLTKILNNGFERDSTVARTRLTKDGEYKQDFFRIFSPKILANRNFFQDDALESRCISEYMGKDDVREEVLIKLDYKFYERAKKIRNKLLMFRLTQFEKIKPVNQNEVTFKISPRGKQISSPLFTLMNDVDKKHLEKVMLDIENNVKIMRNNSLDADVVKILFNQLKQHNRFITVKEISDKLNIGLEKWEKITARKVGTILSNLNITRERGGIGGNFTVNTITNKNQIVSLAKHYNIYSEQAEQSNIENNSNKIKKNK